MLHFPKQIKNTRTAIEGYKSDMARLEANTAEVKEGINPMTVGKHSFTERKDAGTALIEACQAVKDTEAVKIGSYRGFEMSISFDVHSKEHKCHLKGDMTHTVSLGTDPVGNITRIDNALDKIAVNLNTVEAKLEKAHKTVTAFQRSGAFSLS